MATKTTLNLCGILSESKKIVNAHSRHFLALSVLFLLPLSFSFVAFPALRNTLGFSDESHTESLFRYSPEQLCLIKTLALSIFYAFAVLILSLSAIATITYSVFHGFFGRPVKFVSAIKSLFNSLLRLLATFLCAEMIALGVSVSVGFLTVLVIKGIEFLGFHLQFLSSSSSAYSTAVFSIGLVVLAVLLVYLKVTWALASVIVVVESSWGLEPLRRSSYLMKGMKGVAFYLLMFFGLLMGFLVWGSWGLMNSWGGGWNNLIFIVEIVATSAFLTLLLLHSVAAKTVLYMYCKALHGELAGEIAEEFARGYVSLPFDNEKVPHVVYVAQP